MHLRHEIVRVLDSATLINSQSRKCTYCAGRGRALIPGIYLVFWPPDVTTPRYDGEARFVGPFSLGRHAKTMLHRCIQEFYAQTRQAGAKSLIH